MIKYDEQVDKMLYIKQKMIYCFINRIDKSREIYLIKLNQREIQLLSFQIGLCYFDCYWVSQSELMFMSAAY